MANISFDPVKDIEDQCGRVFFVTGGTTGLGASFVSLVAAKNPAHVFFSGRNVSRANELISKVKAASPNVKLSFIECDLSSFASVKRAANQFLSESDRLDVLMNNAGVMALDEGLSKDGYEIQFATNHLGHAMLMKLLLPRMLKTAEQPGSDVRIVNLSSIAYKSIPSAGIEFNTLKTTQGSLGPFLAPSKWYRYGQSKLANLLYPQELARRYPSIKSVAVHPGFIKTELHSTEGFADRILVSIISGGNWISVEQGSYNQTWAATTSRSNLENGVYYEPVGIKGKLAVAQARDQRLAEQLWTWTEKELAQFS